MRTLRWNLVVAFLGIPEAFAEWKYSGNVAPYFQSFNFSTHERVPSQRYGVQQELRLEKKMSGGWRFKSETWFRTDFNSPDAVEFFQWNIKSLYLQKKSGSLTYRLGYQTMVTEGPDIVNPADVVHAKNWVDPTNPVTLGSFGLSLSQEIAKWNWELLYIPSQTRPVLPGEHSPWLPRKNRLPIESEDTELRIPDNVTYQYLAPEELQHATQHNVAAKLGRKSESLEFQLLYFNGLAQSPFLLTNVNASLIAVNPKQVLLVDGPVRLKPLYYRQQAVAGTFVLPFESWAIRGGANWFRPYGSDDRVPSETSMAVLGVEKSVETPVGVITGIIEHVRQKKLDESQISFLRSVMQEAWTFGVRIPWGEETTVLLGGIYDQVGGSSVYRGSVSHRLSNSWSVEGGAQYMQGPQKTLLGIYEKYDSYQFRLQYAW